MTVKTARQTARAGGVVCAYVRGSKILDKKGYNMYIVKDNAKFWDLVNKGRGRRLSVVRKQAAAGVGELVEIVAVIDGNKIYCAYCWPEVLAYVWESKSI